MTTFLPILPGVGATFYGSLPKDLEAHHNVLRASEIVTLHTCASADDPANADVVRRINPAARVWLGLPANYLSRMDLAKGRAAVLAECERVARTALAMGAELLELNGEGASDGKVKGDWTSEKGDAVEVARLESLGSDVMRVLRAVLGTRCAIGWTSHDGTGFRVPRALLAEIDLHGPQHYPADPRWVVSQKMLDRRTQWSRGQWEALAFRGGCPAAVAPYGARWSPYLQGHGHSLGALVWGLSEAPVVRLWACPSSWSAEAVPAIQMARRLRAVAGYGDGAVERFQTMVGLTADGVVGPATLRALEVAP